MPPPLREDRKENGNEDVVEAAYAPGSWPDQRGNNLVLGTVVHSVQSLCISRYVYSNRLVLSKPLSCYLLVHNMNGINKMDMKKVV
jgi:hypothetical protein